MRFEQVAVPLVPRTTSNCLDLAVVFLRAHFAPIARLWALVALPSCVSVYVLVDRFEFKMPLALAVFFFVTSPLGSLLISGAAPCAFGEPFTFQRTLQRLGPRGVGLILWGLAVRCLAALGILLFIFPGWYLLVRTGFRVEKVALSRIADHLHDRRTSELIKGEMGDLFARSAGILLFSFLLWLALLLTIDFASSTLLGLPILFGRLQADWSYMDELGNVMIYAFGFLWSDPIVITASLATALMVYPLGRLAWFFCYLDVRVRRDCWDMELQITQEAERLGAA